MKSLMNIWIPLIVTMSVLLLKQEHLIFIFVMCLLYIAHQKWYVNYSKNQDTKEVENESKMIWKRYSEMIKGKQVLNNHIFHVHKAPKQIKYIHMHRDLKDKLEDLEFILKYEPDLVLDIIIYLEFFLKIHYNIMINKYNIELYLPVLYDIKDTIFNLLSFSTFNLPSVSSIVDIPNIDEYIFIKRQDIHVLLNKYINILKHKKEPSNTELWYDPLLNFSLLK